MKRFYRLICIIFAAMLCFTAVACDGNKPGPDNPDNGNNGNNTAIETTGEKLFSGGSSDYTLVIPESATDYEEYAASEMAYFLQMSTGGTIKVDNDANVSYSDGAKIISLGATRMRGETGKTYTEDELGLSGYRINTVGKSVFISGANEHGTLYGVYEFLKHTANYEFFSDDEIVIDKTPDLDVLKFDITTIPSIQRRALGYKPLWNSASYTKRLRLVDFSEGYIIDGHTFGTILPNDEYSTEHPDWFADHTASNSQPCFTNDDVFEEFVKNSKKIITNHFEAGGTGRYFMLGQNDNGAFCTCAKCTEAKKKYGTVSGVLLYFVNRVTEALDAWLATAYPDKHLEYPTYAYIESMDPPIAFNSTTGQWNEPTIRPRDDVFVMITPLSADWTYSFDDSRNSTMNSVINGWGNVTSNLWIYSYCVNFKQYFLPYNNYNILAANYRVANKYNMYAYYEQGANQSSTTGLMELKFYLISNLLWDCNQDGEALAEKFIRQYYGPVSDYMLEYYNMIRMWYGHIQEELEPPFRTNIYADICQEKYWPFDLVNNWKKNIFDKAYDSIAYLETLDNEAYTKYYNRIKKEELSLTYLFVTLHSAQFTGSELTAMINDFEYYTTQFQLNYYIEGAYTKDMIENWRKKF